MATAAGIIMLTGGITLANEALGAPYEQTATDVIGHINWRVIPATAVAALIFSGIEKVNAPAGKGLAALALLTTLFVGMGNSPTPIEHLSAIFGYAPVLNQGSSGKVLKTEN